MNKTNLFVDFGIFAALLIAAAPGLTGLAVHEWFSLAFAGTIIVHLLLHWKWIASVTVQFFRKLFHTSRPQFVVDLLLFVAFVAAILSGLVISRTVLPLLGIVARRNQVWTVLHSLSASVTVILVGLHFALHWNWVVSMTGRYLVHPITALFGAHKQPAAAPVEISKQ
jgi:hypothetical protein